MVGLLLWNQGNRFPRPVHLREVSVLHVRFLCAAPTRGAQTPVGVQRRRLRAAGKKLLRQGVERVLVTADALSGEVVRTVTELALRHRWLLLEVPCGGEELCRRLRREYGVSVLLHPAAGEPAAVQIAFDPAERRGESFLPLYDEALPMPRLLLPPELEARLPEGANRGQMLSVLWEMGALRPGQVSLRLESAGEPAEPA